MRSFVFTPLVLLAALARAADPLPGHSTHGEAFNEGPRQAAVLIPGCGAVNFPITTANPEAQQFFNQGVGQLHGFWYYEAERSFRQVAALDPACAMAYWGMAMANVNNDKRAKGFLVKATELKAKAGAREKLWIGSLEKFYKEDDKRDKKQRALDFIADLETIVQDFPKDVEARAFLAWKIWHAKGDAPISSLQAVDALLDQVFAANPNHPAHHYRIHLWDGSKPARAVKSAALNGQAAPAIAHMWHMPGHTYSKLKRHDDAAWQQEASTRVDHAYMMRQFVLPDQIHNYAHNEEWLVRTFNDLGRARDAINLAASLIAVPRHPAFNTLEKTNSSASYGRTRLLETLQKWELWQELLALTSGPLLGPVTQENHAAARFRALGVAHFHRDDSNALAGVIRELETLEKTVAAKARSAPAKGAAQKATTAAASKDGANPSKAAAPPAKATAKAKATASSTAAGQSAPAAAATTPAKPAAPKPIPAALAELRALQAVLKAGDEGTGETAHDEAGKWLAAAKDMPKDRLARCWLRLGKMDKAEAAIKDAPRDLVGLGARIEVFEAAGKAGEARKAFDELKALAFAMDTDLPLSKRLGAYAAAHGIDGGWAGSPPKRTDNGKRPPLRDLGPLHWSPPRAPAWQAHMLDDTATRDATHAGKPHLLLFYLGSACTHCMEQLEAFAKAADKFKEAGIALTAITPEPVEQAGRVAERMKSGQLPPFPVCSDPTLAAFKAFHAYDDFEKQPLHAAVLIDSEGYLRWIDVSWQPFTDTGFLLEEAQRLLKFTPQPGVAGR